MCCNLHHGLFCNGMHGPQTNLRKQQLQGLHLHATREDDSLRAAPGYVCQVLTSS